MPMVWGASVHGTARTIPSPPTAPGVVVCVQQLSAADHVKHSITAGCDLQRGDASGLQRAEVVSCRCWSAAAWQRPSASALTEDATRRPYCTCMHAHLL